MKTKTSSFIIVMLVLMVSFTACLKDNVTIRTYHYTDEEYRTITQDLSLPKDLIDYRVELPRHMRDLGMIPPNISNVKATLGRVLFYDKKLSANNTVSCESCHRQNLAFSDDVDFSEGFNSQKTLRNSLALGSVANFESSYGSANNFAQARAFFFWDERAHSISQQSLLTIEDDIEMGMDLNELVTKLSQEDYYRILFRKVYGDENINANRISEALQEFVNSMLSVDSKFDEGMDRRLNVFQGFNNFSNQENIGKQLFLDNCGVCHGNDMSRNSETIANNGLDAVYTDLGVGAITGRSFDDGKFKIPFLRNIALTGPYMHDGRFETLYDVIDHYSSGIQMSENLDFRLRDPSNSSEPLKMNFTDEEKQALVAFLETLTDNTFLTAEKFGDPFN
ncbi:MAG: c-type cytochrome [Saprospiraceae bacterium]|nr:c-type cytochrome [Saprospiraceae bacterium]